MKAALSQLAKNLYRKRKKVATKLVEDEPDSGYVKMYKEQIKQSQLRQEFWFNFYNPKSPDLPLLENEMNEKYYL